MLALAHAVGIILLWEISKYIKQQWKEASERSDGLRWTCPDCRTTFASTSAEVVAHLIVDHDMKFHPEKKGDNDA